MAVLSLRMDNSFLIGFNNCKRLAVDSVAGFSAYATGLRRLAELLRLSLVHNNMEYMMPSDHLSSPRLTIRVWMPKTECKCTFWELYSIEWFHLSPMDCRQKYQLRCGFHCYYIVFPLQRSPFSELIRFASSYCSTMFLLIWPRSSWFFDAIFCVLCIPLQNLRNDELIWIYAVHFVWGSVNYIFVMMIMRLLNYCFYDVFEKHWL